MSCVHLKAYGIQPTTTKFMSEACVITASKVFMRVADEGVRIGLSTSQQVTSHAFECWPVIYTQNHS